MKHLLSFLLTVIIVIPFTLGISAYDYYGKVMPDHINNVEDFTMSVSKDLSFDGKIYDSGRIYVLVTPDLDVAVPSDGAFIQASFPAEVKATDYRFIKIGYKALAKNSPADTAVDINVGIDNVRFWGTKPTMTLDGEYREVTFDASMLTGGEKYNGAANPGYSGLSSNAKYTSVRIKPWGTHVQTQVERDANDYFELEYIAFFKTQAEADAYTTISTNDKIYSNSKLAVFDYSLSSSSFEATRISSNLQTPYVRFTPTCEIGAAAPESAAIQINSPNILNENIKKHKYFTLYYRTNIKNSTTIDFNIGVSYGNGSARLWGPRVDFTNNGQTSKLIIDLSSLNYTGGAEGYYAPDDGKSIWDMVTNITYIRLKPYFRKTVLENEYFDLIAYGLFDSYEVAKAFTPDDLESPIYKGDINCDSVINPADEIEFARLLVDGNNELYDEYNYLDLDNDYEVTALDHAILARNIAGWKKYHSLYTKSIDYDEFVEPLNEEFEERVNEILNSESEWSVSGSNKVYYVSPNGNDSNDGLSPDRPWKTTSKIRKAGLKNGDVVLFKRGGIWRGKFDSIAGVTYSAYGTGPKPAFYGSVDGADPSDWSEVYDNVWQFTERTFDIATEDVGCIIFDEGEAYGARVLTNAEGIMMSVGMGGLTSNGLEQWVRPAGSYADETTLSHDLEYFLNPESGYVYVYSEENPGKRFYSVELSTKGNIIKAYSNTTFDNLCIKYGASHGIGLGTANNVTVRNCEVGWIGGAIQNYSNDVTGRYGNGVEIYGAANNFKVYNNYVYECFDCGVTVQRQGSISSGSTIQMIDSLFYDNVIERCNSPIECWLTHPDEPTADTYAYMNNVCFENNLLRRSGWGFGGYIHTKTDNNIFYGGGKTNAVMINSFIRNNKIWDVRNLVILAHPTSTNYGKGFIWKDNLIVIEYGTVFARTAQNLHTTTGNFANYYYLTDDQMSIFELYKVIGQNQIFTYLP